MNWFDYLEVCELKEFIWLFKMCAIEIEKHQSVLLYF